MLFYALILNGIFVCTASWMKRKNYSFPAIISHLLTLFGIVLTRILFVSKDFNQAVNMFRSLINFKNMDLYRYTSQITENLTIISLITGCCIIFFAKNTNYIMQNFKPSISKIIQTIFIAGLAIAFMGRESSFLYFQF